MGSLAKALLFKLIFQGLGFFLPILILYYDSAETFGEFVIFNTLALITATLLGFSLGNTHIYFNNRLSFLILLTSSAFLAIACWLLACLSTCNWLYLAGLYSIQKFNFAFLRDKVHLGKFFGLQIAERVLFFLLIISFYKSGRDIPHLILLLTVSVASITVPTFLIILAKTYRAELTKYSQEDTIPKILKWTLKGHIGVAAQKLNARANVLALAIFLSPSDVAYYNILVSLSILVWTVPEALNSFFLRELVNSNDKKKILLVKKYSAVVLTLSCFLLVAFSIGFPFISVVYRSFPNQYEWLLVPLTVGTSIFAVTKVRIRYFTSRNRPDIGSKAATISLANTLTIALVLIYFLDIYGAVIASAIGCIMASAYVVRIPLSLK